jgi:hypothetical protein
VEIRGILIGKADQLKIYAWTLAAVARRKFPQTEVVTIPHTRSNMHKRSTSHFDEMKTRRDEKKMFWQVLAISKQMPLRNVLKNHAQL